MTALVPSPRVPADDLVFTGADRVVLADLLDEEPAVDELGVEVGRGPMIVVAVTLLVDAVAVGVVLGVLIAWARS